MHQLDDLFSEGLEHFANCPECQKAASEIDPNEPVFELILEDQS